jgi:hypothetical protein
LNKARLRCVQQMQKAADMAAAFASGGKRFARRSAFHE